MKKSCVAAYPVGWPDGRGISGRMRVEWVAGSPWNRWSDAHGMGGQMTVESAMVCSANSGDVLEVSIQGIVKDAAAETLRSIERVDIRELAEWFHSVSDRNFELAGRTLDIRAVGYWPRGGGDRVSADEDFREDALQRQVGRPALRM